MVEKSVQKNPHKVAAIIYNMKSSAVINKAFNCPNVHIVYYLLFLLLLWVINDLPYWPPFINDPPLNFCKLLDNEKQILNFQDKTEHSQGFPLPLWGKGEVDGMPMELPRQGAAAGGHGDLCGNICGEERLTGIAGGRWETEGTWRKAGGLWLVLEQRQLLVCPQTCGCRVGLVKAKAKGCRKGRSRSEPCTNVRSLTSGYGAGTWTCRGPMVMDLTMSSSEVFFWPGAQTQDSEQSCKGLWAPQTVHSPLRPLGTSAWGELKLTSSDCNRYEECREVVGHLFHSAWRTLWREE